MDKNRSLELFRKNREKMLSGGGKEKISIQHSKGKRTARERINLLFDYESFIEHQPYVLSRATEFGMDKKKQFGDGVITGSGKINGRQVFCSSQDFTIIGGSLGEMHANRIHEIIMLALKNGKPYIQINDSGGARIQEGILPLDGYGKIFKANTLASGIIPQISITLGPCAGGAVYSPALTDFTIMVDGISNMFITGPNVVKAVTGETISHEELGGAKANCNKSGNAHFRFETEEDSFDLIKRLLSYLPSNNSELPPLGETLDPVDRKIPECLDILPDNPKKPYDVRKLIDYIFDEKTFIEVHAEYAPNIVVGFAKLGGRTVGIFANQPLYFAASIDINASDKAARFIRFCDSFNIPLISLVDVPGFLAGVSQEHGGIIRHGAKILYAISEATVPKLSLIIRKAYGGAYVAMASKSLGYDRVLAFPTAEIAVMGGEGAASIIFKREIESARNREEVKSIKIKEYTDKVMNPFIAASYGLVDDIIEPENCRIELIRSLEMNINKVEHRPIKKHGNIPL